MRLRLRELIPKMYHMYGFQQVVFELCKKRTTNNHAVLYVLAFGLLILTISDAPGACGKTRLLMLSLNFSQHLPYQSLANLCGELCQVLGYIVVPNSWISRLLSIYTTRIFTQNNTTLEMSISQNNRFIVSGNKKLIHEFGTAI